MPSASERVGNGKRAPETAAGRGDAGERGDERSLEKKVVSAPARRELVRQMVIHGLSERRSLRVIGMSARAYRYEPAQDRNCALKEKISAVSPTASALRRRHDLFEAAPGRGTGQSQARGPSVRRGGFAGEEAQAQEDPAE